MPRFAESAPLDTTYAGAAPVYFANGWQPLPVFSGKGVTPPGTTGYAGALVAEEDIQRWSKSGSERLCLRMVGTVGIDVDAYAEDCEWGALLAELGPLPETWVSSSRFEDDDYDGHSGIRLFRLPAEYIDRQREAVWRGALGRHVEVVRFGHRQVNAWPTMHKRGTRYEWRHGGTGEVADGPLPVRPEDLPELPVAWAEAMLKPAHEKNGSQKLGVKVPKAASPEARAAVEEWWTPGDPCPPVQKALEELLEELPHNRHDTAVPGMVRLTRLGEQGHRGVGTAIAELRDAFLAELDGDESRTEAPEDEWSRAEAGIFAELSAGGFTPDVDKGCCGPRSSGESRLLELERTLFEATPQLGLIRQAARARLASPWSVVGAVLARVNAELPPSVVLPPTIQSKASVNLAVALVDTSGGGKSGSVGLSAEVLAMDAPKARVIGPGSGEGLIQTFLEWDPKMRVNRPAKVRQALLIADEIGQVGAVQERNGSTSGSVLRSMLTGGQATTTNADASRNRSLEPHSYRLSVLSGVQPELSDVLLKDAHAGTPQRWVWLPASDPAMPDVEPSWPGVLDWVLPDLTVFPMGRWDRGFLPVTLPEEVAQEVKDAHRARVRGRSGAVDPSLDGHRMLTRLKVAVTLAALHGELDVTKDWWELAGVVMEVSDIVRGWCVAALRDGKDREDVGRGRADALRERAARSVRDDEEEKDAAALWKLVAAPTHPDMRHQPGQGCTERCLTRALRHRRGADKAKAKARAVELGWLEDREGRWFPGVSQPSEVES